jgi:PST family polysaccharide transporter
MLLPITQLINPISSVAMPVLSRLQDDQERFRRYYFGAINLLAFFLCPTMITMAVMSDEIVFLLLGPQWVGASLIFKTLSIVAIIQPLYASTGWIYQSLGKTDRMMRWGLISVPVYMISFIAGLPWGANGVAIAYTISSYILLVPGIMYAFKGTSLHVHDFFQAILCPFITGIGIYIIITLYHSSMHFLPPWFFLIGSGIFAVFTLILSTLFWPRARKEAEQLWKTLNVFRSGESIVG